MNKFTSEYVTCNDCKSKYKTEDILPDTISQCCVDTFEKYGYFGYSNGKPPLGLIPERIFYEGRRTDINSAIERYIKAKKDIPWQWVNELLVLEVRLRGI